MRIHSVVANRTFYDKKLDALIDDSVHNYEPIVEHIRKASSTAIESVGLPIRARAIISLRGASIQSRINAPACDIDICCNLQLTLSRTARTQADLTESGNAFLRMFASKLLANLVKASEMRLVAIWINGRCATLWGRNTSKEIESEVYKYWGDSTEVKKLGVIIQLPAPWEFRSIDLSILMPSVADRYSSLLSPTSFSFVFGHVFFSQEEFQRATYLEGTLRTAFREANKSLDFVRLHNLQGKTITGLRQRLLLAAHNKNEKDLAFMCDFLNRPNVVFSRYVKRIANQLVEYLAQRCTAAELQIAMATTIQKIHESHLWSCFDENLLSNAWKIINELQEVSSKLSSTSTSHALDTFALVGGYADDQAAAFIDASNY